MKDYINPNFKHLVHGADYNPEQWMDYPGIWEEDMRLMKLAHMNELTVGIFSWAKLEPREGEYDFSFLDEIIEKIAKNGGKVILATPSGARPHWMAEKYPEVLRVGPDGIRNLYGARHNHCYTSAVYREKVKQMNTRLAQRYGHHPAVLAWHISNEYNGDCHCPLCQEAFRSFLKERYHNDIHALNHAWWTTFWSHTYDSFDQIEIPCARGEISVHGLSLDYQRFVTAQTKRFIENELLPIREICPDVPVTINMMPGFTGLDYRAFADLLEFASIDVYPDWHRPDQPQVPMQTAFWYDYYRCLCERPFYLMESAPGLTNWKPYNKLKRPGMDRAASLQAVAHGSDSVQYFQFRKSRGSSEKFHGAVVDHVGNEHTRVFRAIADTGRTLEKIDEIAGTTVVSRVALLFDVENLWALEKAEGFLKDDKGYFEACYSLYRPLWRRGISVDIVDARRDLSKYDLVIAPMLYLTEEKTAQSLASFVKNGGTLLATYLLAMVNETDLCYLGGFPGAGLREVFGLRNEEIDSLYPSDRFSVVMGEKEYVGKNYAELLYLEGATALASYQSEFYAGMPAYTRNSYGKGQAYYLAFCDQGDFADDILSDLLAQCNITSPLGELTPFADGVTLHERTDGEAHYLFVENYSESAQTVALPFSAKEMETGECLDCVCLDAFDVKVLKR